MSSSIQSQGRAKFNIYCGVPLISQYLFRLLKYCFVLTVAFYLILRHLLF